METESYCPTQTRFPPPVGSGKGRGISEEREEHLRVLETAEQKEASSAPFQAERRQAESAEEREALLSKRRTIDRAKRQALSTKQTEERLQLLRCYFAALAHY